MIRDLSETLRAILDDAALAASFPELAAAQIAFDRPDDNFNPTQPTVNLFLYDVREDMELRSNEPVLSFSNGQPQIRRAPLRVACSYLLTAWPIGGPDVALQEHRLLSQALMALARYQKIPDNFLQGELKKQRPVNDEAKKKLFPMLPMLTAKMEGVKDPHEFWAAIGGKMRASIIVTATIAMELVAPEDSTLVVTQELRFGERTSPHETKLKPATALDLFRISGKVTDATDKPVTDGKVSLVGTGLLVTTDGAGEYVLGSVTAGNYTLHVQASAGTKDVPITIPAIAGKNYNVKL
jgi:hypothetical protein